MTIDDLFRSRLSRSCCWEKRMGAVIDVERRLVLSENGVRAEIEAQPNQPRS